MKLKDQILQLRQEGKTYKEIQETLGCSKGLICYYCGDNQKDKTYKRTQKRRKETVISQKVEAFQRQIRDKSEDFQRERLINKKGISFLGKRNLTFRWYDVIEKYGWQTNCYLTGRPINLHETHTYHFDHKMPYSKGGSSEIENLGITCKEANLAKSNMTIEEFLQICKETLEFNGYEVKLKTS